MRPREKAIEKLREREMCETKREGNRKTKREGYMCKTKREGNRETKRENYIHSYLPEEAPFGMVAILGR